MKTIAAPTAEMFANVIKIIIRIKYKTEYDWSDGIRKYFPYIEEIQFLRNFCVIYYICVKFDSVALD